MSGAGTDKTKRWIEQPAPIVVLVEPQMGENIGAGCSIQRLVLSVPAPDMTFSPPYRCSLPLQRRSGKPSFFCGFAPAPLASAPAAQRSYVFIRALPPSGADAIGRAPNSPSIEFPATKGASMPDLEIVWTKVDEAPALATYSLLPIVEA